MEYYFGLDFGSSNTNVSCISIDSKKPIRDLTEKVKVPSMAYCTDAGELVFGNDAINLARLENNSIIDDIKLTALLAKDTISFNGIDIAVKDVINGIITQVLNKAVDYLSNDYFEGYQFDESSVINIVATYPSVNCCERYMKTLKSVINNVKLDCGASIKLVGMIPEPASAAISFLDSKNSCENVIVFDLGGGTMDCAVMEVNQNDDNSYSYEQKLPVISKRIGGKDWDATLLQVVTAQFVDKYNNPQDISRLSKLASFTIQIEQNKIDLNKIQSMNISNPFYTEQFVNVTRDKFFDSTKGYIQEARKHITKVIRRFADKYSDEKLDNIICVGGGTMMRDVEEFVDGFASENADYFSRHDIKAKHYCRLYAVAYGAALCSYFGISRDDEQDKSNDSTSQSNVSIVQKTNHIYGVEGLNESFRVGMVIDANETLPIQSPIYSTDCNESFEIRLYAFDEEYRSDQPLPINPEYYIGTYTYDFTGISGIKRFSFIVDENNEICLVVTDSESKIIEPVSVWGN